MPGLNRHKSPYTTIKISKYEGWLKGLVEGKSHIPGTATWSFIALSKLDEGVPKLNGDGWREKSYMTDSTE